MPIWPVSSAPSLRIFSEGGSSALHRLDSKAQAPHLRPERVAIESYGIWLSLDEGGVMTISFIVSNLGRTNQPAISLSCFPRSGAPFRANVEYAPSDLHPSSAGLAFQGNAIHFLPDGQARVRIDAPSTAGPLQLHLSLTPLLDGVRKGDGRVHFGAEADEAFFELLVLMPKARVSGEMWLAGKRTRVEGIGYLDHTTQTVWAHKIAQRWINFRFWGSRHTIAWTSFRTPRDAGAQDIVHALVIDNDSQATSPKSSTIALLDVQTDPESAFDIPGRLRLHARDGGKPFELELPLGTPRERIDMLGELNPILRFFIRTFIARPYSFRYTGTARASFVEEGNKTSEEGRFLAEIILLNP